MFKEGDIVTDGYRRLKILKIVEGYYLYRQLNGQSFHFTPRNLTSIIKLISADGAIGIDSPLGHRLKNLRIVLT